MKKPFTIICIAAMLLIAFGLCSCGNNSDDVSKEASAQQINYTERTFIIIDKLVNNKVEDFYSYFDENMKKRYRWQICSKYGQITSEHMALLIITKPILP